MSSLEDAGLHVEVETAERPEDEDTVDYASLPKGSLLDVSPEHGSVIDVGGTVTATVARAPDAER